MKKKQRSKNHREEVEFLSQQLRDNGRAMEEGPKRKRWSTHDIKSITPLTQTQKDMFQQFYQGDQLCAYGSAGTGKSFIALFLAIGDVLDHNRPQKRIIIVRSAVPTRDMGFMPGTLEEKNSLYEAPYRDIFADLFGRKNTYEDMKEARLVEFMTTSYVRGLTWDDAIVVVDEVQNMSWHEIHSIMTRIGKDSRVIFTGDMTQTDLANHKDKSGMDQFIRVIKKMKEFGIVYFTTDDIVRSSLVKSWIVAVESHTGTKL